MPIWWEIVTLLVNLHFLIMVILNTLKIIGFISFIFYKLSVHTFGFFFHWVMLQRLASSSVNPFHFSPKCIAKLCFPDPVQFIWFPDGVLALILISLCRSQVQDRSHEAKIKLLAVLCSSLQTLRRNNLFSCSFRSLAEFISLWL